MPQAQNYKPCDLNTTFHKLSRKNPYNTTSTTMLVIVWYYSVVYVQDTNGLLNINLTYVSMSTQSSLR